MTGLFLLLLLFPGIAAAEKAPGFWISNMEGKRFISKKHQGGIIIISFFYVSCIPCIAEVPKLYKLLDEEIPSSNVKLLFIDSLESDTKQGIINFAERRGVPTRYFYHDTFGRLARKFFGKIMKFPAIVGIKNGEIVFKFHEFNDETVEEIRATFGN